MFIDRACPIVACSSSTHGTSAIALIRLSGFKSFKELDPFFSKKVSSLDDRKAELCYLLDPETSERLDHILVTKFSAPHSYTSENMLELSVHGNPLNVQRVLEIFLSLQNMEHAEPGEFTYRAFKNKKLSLSQVEGLDLFLHAKSEGVLKESFKALHGELHEEYSSLRDSFLEVKAALELNIDFSEDIGEEEGLELYNKRVLILKTKIDELSRRVSGNLEHLLSPKIVLLGKTNAGKSSFFNALLGHNRAIVTNVHGTTRDYVSEPIKIGQQSFLLYDTAGLRETEDIVEKEGIERTRKLLRNAFFKVLVMNPFDEESTQNQELNSADALVLTHADLEGFEEKTKQFQGFSLPTIHFSSQTGPIGPEFPLLDVISDSYERLMDSEPILVQRQRSLIQRVEEHFKIFLEVSSSEDFGLISSELRILGLMTEELIGVVHSDDVLDHIFSNFCIGK